jgi:predicted acetyltransferase
MLQIEPATPRDAELLGNLLQLYLYEITEFEHRDIGPDGLFEHRRLDDYGCEDGPCALLARAAGRPLGFSLVHEGSILDAAATNVRTIAEFFVLRAHRRRGLGRLLARETFRRFRGRWEVRVGEANLPAQAFWRNVIADYTAGAFVELRLQDHRWHGPIQTFDNSLMVG